MKQIVFNRRNELLRVPLTRAMFYEAFGNYCYGVFANKQKVMLPVGLAEVERLIQVSPEADQPTFIRICKRYIVNADMIVQVNMSTQRLILSDFDHPDHFALPISKDALRAIKQLYEQQMIWK